MIEMHVAGINCYDWSKMGSRSKWLGSSTLPFLQWCLERLVQMEDMIQVECVLDFPHEVLIKAFGDTRTLRVLKLSPTTQGIPNNRERKYMILTSTQKIQWHEVSERWQDDTWLYKDLFRRPCELTGQVYFRADELSCAEHIKQLALKRGLTTHRSSGRQWSYKQVVCPGIRIRMAGYLKFDQEAGHKEKPALVFNVMQTPSHFRSTGVLMPTLMRSSLLWSPYQGRCLLPLEHMEVLGHKCYKSSPEESDKELCNFLPALHKLSSCQIRAMAGNGMHLASVGGALCYTLALIQWK